LNRNAAYQLLFLIVFVGLVGFTVYKIQNGRVIETNILSLLPKEKGNALMHHTDATLAQRMEKTVLVLAEHHSAQLAASAAQSMNETLQKTALFAKSDVSFNQGAISKNIDFYRRFNHALLTSSQIDALKKNDLASIRANLISKTYGMSMDIGGGDIIDDPLFLFTDYITDALGQNLKNAQLIGNIPVFSVSGKHYALLQLKLIESPFSLDYQDKVIGALDAAQKNAAFQLPDIEIIRSGFLFHAHQGAKTAKKESSVMGGLSLLGVFLLMIWAFRSIKPFIAVALSILGGAIAGFAACLLFFDHVHILTLVFGTSLIGISVDYTLHFFAAREDKASWNANKVISQISPGITLGLLTSLIGFLALCTTPFLGLQQMAVFCMAGLIFVYGCVVLVYPIIFQNPPFKQTNPLIDKLARLYSDWWANRSYFTIQKVIVFLCAVCCLALPFLNGKDDVRALQSLSPSLVENDVKSADVLGRSFSTQYFVVKGANDDEMLEQLAILTARLERLKQDGSLDDYRSMNAYIPSHKRQRNNALLLEVFMRENQTALKNLFSELSFPEKTYETYMGRIQEALKNNHFFSLEDLQQNLKNTKIDMLYGGDFNNEKITFVTLSGVRDLSELSALQNMNSNIIFFDKVSSLSQLLNHYRFMASLQAIGAYGLILLFLIIRYGLRLGSLLIAPSILAALLTLSLISLTQGSYSLFHIIALFLVMGIGMDYGLFIAESKKHTNSALVAIVLSALTTILSFGLLSGSDTSALHDFGITITIGIVITVILLPLITITFNPEKPRK